MSLPSDLQAAISNLQSKHSGLVAAVRGYSGGSVATRTNTKLAEHRAGVKAMDVRTASLRRQIGQFEDTLLLDFVNSMYLSGEGGLDRAYKLQGLVSFSRASIGTYVDSNGLLKTAAANEPRINFDPVTGACKGLLIEEQRTNLLQRSEEFDKGVWAKGRSSISPDSALAPSGVLAADKLVEDSTASNTHLLSVDVSVTSGAAYTFSVYAKSAEREHVRLNFQATGFGSLIGANFNLAIGAVSVASPGITASIAEAGSGFYRCSITATATDTTSTTAEIRLTLPDNTTIYTGDGTSGIYIWGAQLEAGAFPTSHIPTAAAQVTRAADVATVNELSPWFNPEQGTWLAEFVPAAGVSLPRLISYSNTARSFLELGGNGRLGTWSGVQLQTTNNATYGAANKGAITYSSVGRSLSLNGGAVASDTNHIAPAVNGILLGANHAGAQYLNGHIRSIRYFPRALSSEELQAITA